MEWIKVSDLLPADKQTCICWSDDHDHPFVARYIGGRDFHDFFKNYVGVSHWMPMPESPEE